MSKMSDAGVTDLASTVCAEIDAAREELVALCGELVAAQSVNPPGRTADVADVVRRYLAANGMPSEIVKADAEAPNVIAQIAGVSGGRHVVFNAHMDTMEAGDESAWSVPVLRLTRRDGRLYGLGLGNMKGALAAMCVVSAVLHRHRNADLDGDFLISGEGPGFMGFAVAEKGLLWLDIEARAPGGHASRALRGETAVMRLAALLARLDAMNNIYAALPRELEGVSGGEGNLGLRLSLNAGTIAAGTVRSQVARRARAEIDIRLPPGITAQECVAMIRKEAGDGNAGGSIVISVVKSWDANWTALDNPLVVALVEAAQVVRGAKPAFVVRLPGSDARRWRDLGVPAVCYGPQPTLSAGVDDYVNEQDLIDCAKIYARTALALMRGYGRFRIPIRKTFIE